MVDHLSEDNIAESAVTDQRDILIEVEVIPVVELRLPVLLPTSIEVAFRPFRRVRHSILKHTTTLRINNHVTGDRSHLSDDR
jgi:hypothetical protein